MITGLDHIQLVMPVGMEDLARRFYRDVLGLVEIAKPVELAKRGGCWFQAQGIQIHLGVESEFQPARKAHPAFLVDDLAFWQERMERSGLKIVPDETFQDRLRFYTYDSFGNRLEFIQAGDGFSQR
jgi:catechol 2,3-dioxygenase-like lactoylglutathione lyase family enzyme